MLPTGEGRAGPWEPRAYVPRCSGAPGRAPRRDNLVQHREGKERSVQGLATRGKAISRSLCPHRQKSPVFPRQDHPALCPALRGPTRHTGCTARGVSALQNIHYFKVQTPAGWCLCRFLMLDFAVSLLCHKLRVLRGGQNLAFTPSSLPNLAQMDLDSHLEPRVFIRA